MQLAWIARMKLCSRDWRRTRAIGGPIHVLPQWPITGLPVSLDCELSCLAQKLGSPTIASTSWRMGVYQQIRKQSVGEGRCNEPTIDGVLQYGHVPVSPRYQVALVLARWAPFPRFCDDADVVWKVYAVTGKCYSE